MEVSRYGKTYKKNNIILIILVTLSMFFFLLYSFILVEIFIPKKNINGSEHVKNIKSGDSVSLTSNEYYDTGVYDKEQISRTPIAIHYYYHLVKIVDSYFVVRTVKKLPKADLGTGKLPDVKFKGYADPHDGRNRKINVFLKEELPEDIRNKVSDYMIDDEKLISSLEHFIIFSPWILFFFIFCIRGLFNNITNRKRLKKYSDIKSAEMSFDSEFSIGHKKFNDLYITQNWLFSSKIGNTFLIPLRQGKIVYAFKTRVIASWKLYMLFYDGSQIDIKANDKICCCIISELKLRGINILTGSDDTKWQKVDTYKRKIGYE